MIKLKKIFFFILVTLFFYESVNGAIKDSLFATVGSKAITRSDIINEIKIILILNGQSFADQDKEKIEASAINSIIKRTIKQIEIDKYGALSFNKSDLDAEVRMLAKSLNIDSDTLIYL